MIVAKANTYLNIETGGRSQHDSEEMLTAEDDGSLPTRRLRGICLPEHVLVALKITRGVGLHHPIDLLRFSWKTKAPEKASVGARR